MVMVGVAATSLFYDWDCPSNIGLSIEGLAEARDFLYTLWARVDTLVDIPPIVFGVVTLCHNHDDKTGTNGMAVRWSHPK